MWFAIAVGSLLGSVPAVFVLVVLAMAVRDGWRDGTYGQVVDHTGTTPEQDQPKE